ncbi:hypothetical protein CEXT_746241 [Caerostris extrusa]|uniref:Uncharacterized protein n=1 Tax=Caerostris extrusa TaxID=172846 RepID=A0AAV4T2T4_CAEEX|nr:hypothetical protein CEXT_746241 [Caerostris extrusa]
MFLANITSTCEILAWEFFFLRDPKYVGEQQVQGLAIHRLKVLILFLLLVGPARNDDETVAETREGRKDLSHESRQWAGFIVVEGMMNHDNTDINSPSYDVLFTHSLSPEGSIE